MKMTENVMKMIWSRATKGAPDEIWRGSASANTSDSAPRSPAHPMNKVDAPWRQRIVAAAQPSANGSEDICAWKNPRDTHKYHGKTDKYSFRSKSLSGISVIPRVTCGVESYENECETFEHKCHYSPHPRRPAPAALAQSPLELYGRCTCLQ